MINSLSHSSILSLLIFYLKIVILEPPVSVSGVIIVNHSSDVSGVVPKIAESS